MNTASESRVEGGVPHPVLVWDAPVRVFHWLLVISFAGAFLTAESERWRLLHVTLGYTVAGLVAFRLVWGLVGTRYARFASFVRGPQAVMAYLASMRRGQPEHHLGHNPAGAVAIVALLTLAIGVSVSGWAVYNGGWGDWLEELHELAANLMLGVVGLHLAGVVVASLRHRENLVRAMFTGYKPGSTTDGIRRAWLPLAGLMLALVLGFWWFQWRTAPDQTVAPAQVHKSDVGHDDD